MKAFIFDPLWHKLVDKKMEEKLQNTGIETIVISTVKPLSETKELFTGTEERLLCLNPDYVGWKLANEDYKNIPKNCFFRHFFNAGRSLSSGGI